MPVFKVKVRFETEGEYVVKAKTKEQAERWVKQMFLHVAPKRKQLRKDSLVVDSVIATENDETTWVSDETNDG